MSDGNRGSRDYHTVGDRLAQRIPRATTPPSQQESRTSRPRSPPLQHGPPGHRHAASPTPPSIPDEPRFRLAPHRHGSETTPGLSGPEAGERTAGSPPRPSPPLGAESIRPHPPAAGSRARVRHVPASAPTLGEGRKRTLTWLGRLLPSSRPAEPSWGLPGKRGLRGGLAVRGEGGGGRDAGSRLLPPPPPPRLLQPDRAPSHTRPLSHSLAVALARPHPHFHTHSFPHALTPGRSSLPQSPGVRARATPLTHSARDAGGGRPALPRSEAPRAEPGRAPRPRPPDATARPTRGGGWPGEGLCQPAGPRRVALTSATGPAL